MRRSQLAINTVSTRQQGRPQGLREALAAYSAAGFHNVEFVLALVKDWMAQGHSVDEVRQLLSHCNLRAIGGFQTHLECFTSPESQRANQEIHLTNAALIHGLGGGTLVVGTDGPPQPSPDPLDTVAEVLARLAKKIEGLDVNIALEFNWSPVVKSLQSATLVTQKVNHPQVGVLFDPAHYYCTVTKFEHLNAETVKWIKHVHFNDMADKPGEWSNCNSDRVLPGQGILDLRALIAALEKYGYDGFYSIELFNEELWQLPVEEGARQCYQSLLPYCK